MTTLAAMSREIRQNSAAFQDLGIDIYDSSGKMKDMGGIMTEVEAVTGSMSDEQRNMALQTVFSGQAMKGVNAFVGQGSESYNELTEAMYGATGAGQELAEASEDNIGGAMRSMSSALEGLMIHVGDAVKGPISAFADKIAEWALKFGELDEGTQQTIIGIVGLVAAVGPVLFVVSKVIALAGVLAPALGAIPIILGALSTAFAFMISPIGLVIGALVAVGAAIVGMVGAFRRGKEESGTIMGGLKNIFSEGVAFITKAWEGLKNFIAHPIKGTVSLVKKGFNKLTGKGVDGSNKAGLNRVPFDGYISELHKDETVLNKKDAKEYRTSGTKRQTSGNLSYNPSINITVGNGMATNTQTELKRTIKEVMESEREKFFYKLNLQTT